MQYIHKLIKILQINVFSLKLNNYSRVKQNIKSQYSTLNLYSFYTFSLYFIKRILFQTYKMNNNNNINNVIQFYTFILCSIKFLYKHYNSNLYFKSVNKIKFEIILKVFYYLLRFKLFLYFLLLI